MIFLNYDFYQDSESLSPVAVKSAEASVIKISSALFYELFLTKDVSYDMSNTISSNWDINTLLHAMFNNKLTAGNINFILKEISSIRIKRKPHDEYQWITLLDKPVSSLKDLNVHYTDLSNKGKTKYDYACVAVVSGTEGNINNVQVESEFYGMGIIEKDKMLFTNLDIDVDRQLRNRKKKRLKRRHLILKS